jgi:hypothetical protein
LAVNEPALRPRRRQGAIHLIDHLHRRGLLFGSDIRGVPERHFGDTELEVRATLRWHR